MLYEYACVWMCVLCVYVCVFVCVFHGGGGGGIPLCVSVGLVGIIFNVPVQKL